MISNQHKKYFVFAVNVAISAAILYLLYQNFTWHHFEWPKTYKQYCAIAFVTICLACIILLDAFRLYSLVKPNFSKNEHTGLLKKMISTHFWIGGFSLLSPSFMIDEALKVYKLKNIKYDSVSFSALIILNRVLGLSVVLFLFIIGSYYTNIFQAIILKPSMGSLKILGAAVVFFLTLLALYKYKVLKGWGAITSLCQRGLKSFSFLSYSRLFQAISITIVMECLRTLSFAACMVALNIEVNIIAAMMASLVGTLSLLIPIGFNGLGVKEVGVISILKILGYTHSAALSISLLHRLITIMLSILLITYYKISPQKKG